MLEHRQQFIRYNRSCRNSAAGGVGTYQKPGKRFRASPEGRAFSPERKPPQLLFQSGAYYNIDDSRGKTTGFDCVDG